MDSDRVREILESHGIIAVNYENDPVWIEQLTEDHTARVTLLATNETKEVPVSELAEDNP